jgi:hypothetical protein
VQNSERRASKEETLKSPEVSGAQLRCLIIANHYLLPRCNPLKNATTSLCAHMMPSTINYVRTCDVSESLHGQHDPLSIDRIDNNGDLEALKSSDPVKIRAALAKIDPEVLLDQINQPERPKWQTVLEDRVQVKVPQSIFNRWNAERRKDWDHLRFEYDHITETMILKCMPSKIHDRVPARFVRQATLMIDRLSQRAKNEVDVGSTEGAFCLLLI